MRRTIVLFTTMALTVLVASGVALAVTKIGSAGAQSSVVGPGESIQKAVNAAHPGDTIVVRGVHRNIESPRLPADADRAIRPASIQLPSRRIGVASGNL